MEIIESKNLDHHGIVAGVIEDLGLQKLINKRLPKDSKAKVTNGQTIAAMLINSLGFTSRPLTLTPQFFSSKAADVLFGENVKAEDFNRHRLGRCLDEIYSYGCDTLFTELAGHICQQENINQCFTSLDTTSFNLTGNYDVETEEREIKITHGFSKDHRPDLKQIILELVVTQDGGVPVLCKSFDGNTSDSQIFRSRCQTLVEQFKKSEVSRYLVADSKLYSSKNAEYLKALSFITRIPRSIKEEGEAINKAITEDTWITLDSKNKYHRYVCKHNGIKQRWLVVFSTVAQARAKKLLKKQIVQEAEKTKKHLKRLRNAGFSCELDAKNNLKKIEKNLKYHRFEKVSVLSSPCYKGKGRPKSDAKPTHFIYTATAELVEDGEAQSKRITEKSCYVVGSNATEANLSDKEIIRAYKKQNASVERGFRFLKDPYFFASSFFIKKPSRLMALLMIMTLALLVYSVTERRLRTALKKANETLPNQIRKPVKNPTLRWIFQIFEGVHVVHIKTESVIKKIVSGLDNLKLKILSFFSTVVQSFYGLTKNVNKEEKMCSM